MPVSVVWLLRPHGPATLPATLGRAAHAALLACVARRDNALAEELHVPDAPRPHTCSNLLGTRPAGRGAVSVTADCQYRLRFTALDERLSAVLAEPTPTLELDGHTFTVEQALTCQESDPWAGQATWQELSSPWLLKREPVSDRVALEWASATTFRSGGMLVPLPLPGLVFGSLLDRWNAFAPLALHEDLRRYAEECVAVERYRLQTRALPLKKDSLQIGFVGECAYRLLRRDPFWMAQVQLLADAAFYLGVGYQTAVGMGQARRKPSVLDEST